MFDFSQPVTVVIEGQSVGSVMLHANAATMTRTLLERGDVSYLFHDDIVLKKDGQSNWTIEEKK